MLGRRDWMPAHRSRTERILANRNLKNGALILYDVSSSFLEGSFGTVAVKVLPGNVSDPSMAVAQVNKAPHLLRHRPCGAGRGDKSMLTTICGFHPGRSRIVGIRNEGWKGLSRIKCLSEPVQRSGQFMKYPARTSPPKAVIPLPRPKCFDAVCGLEDKSRRSRQDSTIHFRRGRCADHRRPC